MRKTANLKKINFLDSDTYEKVEKRMDELYAVELSSDETLPVFPEYSKKIALEIGQEHVYTVGEGDIDNFSAGWVWYGGKLGVNRTFVINGVTFELAYYNGASGYDSKLLFHPVAQGDRFYAIGGGELYFIPCVGDI